MRIEPYVFFDGRCDEAIDFYRAALGAETLMLLRYSDAPADAGPPPEGCSPPPPGTSDKVMHAALRVGETTVMLSDGMCGGNPKFEGMSLSLTAADDAEAARIFAALADGGQVMVPLGPSFFASSFGMLADRFGVNWMVVAGNAPPAA